MKQNKYKQLYNVGLNYQKADVKIRGMFNISKKRQVALLEDAKNFGIEGLFVISTCNRTEIMGFAHHPFELISFLCKYSNGSVEIFNRVGVIYKEKEAIKHLFRVATGLKSQILGDYEIVGQLKNAFKQAKKQVALNAYLERLINCVLQASKEVKNTTQISSGITSVSYSAIQYILRNIPNFRNQNILVYGLGKMGKRTCKNLKDYIDISKVTLINRTYQKALDFSKGLKGIKILKNNCLEQAIEDSDILILATSSGNPTISLQHIRRNKELTILDLSIPENVSSDVANLPNINLVNVDILSKVTDETLFNRQKEIPKVEAIIERYKAEFMTWLEHRRFTPAVNALKESLAIIQNEAINFHNKKNTNFNIEHAQMVTSQIIQKITTQFVKHLKSEDTSINQSIEIMHKIFDFQTPRDE